MNVFGIVGTIVCQLALEVVDVDVVETVVGIALVLVVDVVDSAVLEAVLEERFM